MAIKNTKLGGVDWDTPTARIKPTDLNDTIDILGDVVNKGLGSIWNDTAQNLFNHAYSGFDSNLNGDGSPNLKNVEYDVFSSNSVTYFDGMEYNSGDKQYQSIDISPAQDYFIDIYTTSSTGISSLGINSCSTINLKNTSSEKIYRLYCTTGTTEEKRAQIIKTLFYGTNGNDPKVSGITGLTALKTSDSDDVGMKFNLTRIYASSSKGYPDDHIYTGTFSDTTSNSKCESWSYVDSYSSGNNLCFTRWEIPSGTIRNSINSDIGGRNTSDETETDTTGDTVSNPQTCEVQHHQQSTDHNSNGYARIITGYKSGTISWAETQTDTTWSSSVNHNDFYVDDGIPLLELADYDKDSEPYVEFQTTGLDTVTNCIPIFNSEINSSNNLTVSVSVDGTNYEEITNANIHRFTNIGTNLNIKFEIERIDNTVVDKISEYAIKYNLY